jgi:integrase
LRGDDFKLAGGCYRLVPGELVKHARRFKWIQANVCEDVRKPRYKVKVHAFTAAEVAASSAEADGFTALLVRTAASTGLRFGEIAGLEWSRVDLEKGVISVVRQFTHGAWSELKTANSRRRVPIAKELLRQLRLHKLRTPGELVFPGHGGAPIEYHNWRSRVWAPLLKKAGVTGNFHIVAALLRHGTDPERRQRQGRADARRPPLGELHARSVRRRGAGAA